MAASSSKSGRIGVARREGVAGTAALVARALAKRRCCSSSELLNCAKGCTRQKCCAAVVSIVVVICSASANRVTQAVCSQACQVAQQAAVRTPPLRARIADEKTTSTTTAAAGVRKPRTARGHRRRHRFLDKKVDVNLEDETLTIGGSRTC